MNLIVAVDKKNAIGKDNDLLFRISADLKNFKNLTTGHVIVYGYNTLLTFPNQKPLKNRVNIILTHKDISIEGAIVVHSVEEAYNEFKKYNTEDIFIVGGESIYNQFYEYCDKCFLTRVYTSTVEGNKFFPDISNWENSGSTILKEGIYDYTYSELINPSPKKYKY